MATLPPPDKVAAKHYEVFDAYYKMVDPKNLGTIEAFAAAKFLKKSGLSDVVLSRIWDLSDPAGRGYLDKTGLFVALKLVALAQAGHDINMRNIFVETNAPRVGDPPKIKPQTAATDWTMKPTDRDKYEKLFESSKPVNGLIPGNAVKEILMKSKLPLETLGKIWDLADQDKDGNLDKHEFCVAMHLVYQALDKKAIPASLPPQLQKPKTPPNTGFGDAGFVANFDNAPPPVVPPMPSAMPPKVPPMSRVPPVMPNLLDGIDLMSMPAAPITTAPTSDWVVSAADKVRYDAIFARSDLDKDGLVSGLEVKDVFLRSGLAQNVLAHIWSLADTDESGKLSIDQFALAMWFVEQKQKGIDPPRVLLPNMVPPSLRPNAVRPMPIDLIAPVEVRPTYDNPELEAMSKEIEEFAREKRALEAEVAQKEADVRIKTGEIRSLQSELDTLTATLKQLENQKGEAQKRLDDLRAQVNKIRDQCQKQEDTLKEQESELDSKRSELQKLKDEENSLNKQYDEGLNELQTLSKNLQDTQLEISQVRLMLSQLEENQRQMNDARSMFRMAIESDNPSIVSEYTLQLEPEFQEAKKLLEDKPKEDPMAASASDGFATDAFRSNGFSDTFKSNGGFDDGFNSGFETAFDNKPDAFGGTSSSDPFNDNKGSAQEASKDGFGCDPFAILHAPTTNAAPATSHSLSPSKAGPPPRPESPSPALPPKKAKQPPPRPAPPRPVQAPKMTSSSDAFGDNTGGSGFANFADFDAKKVSVSVDFVEDPFKNYRYEDPFDIADPFSDDNKDEDPFSDANSIMSATSGDSFPLNKSNKSDDPFYKISHDTSSNGGSTGKTKSNIASDDFFAPTAKMGGLDAFTAPQPQKDKFDFFDSFNDQFTKNNTSKNYASAFGDDKPITPDENENRSALDAFKEDVFGDDFSKLHISTTTAPSTTTTKSTLFSDDDSNFAQFDAFTSAFDVSNTTNNNNNNTINNFDAFSQPKKNGNLKIEKNDWFKDDFDKMAKTTSKKVTSAMAPEDFSKGDTFDADLEAVLKRSMVDQ